MTHSAVFFSYLFLTPVIPIACQQLSDDHREYGAITNCPVKSKNYWYILYFL